MCIMYTREAKILFGVWNAQANKVKNCWDNNPSIQATQSVNIIIILPIINAFGTDSSRWMWNLLLLGLNIFYENVPTERLLV